jgi:hypothetical protein
VKFVLDPFYPLSVIRLHSQNQSPSFHGLQAIPTVGATRIMASDKFITRACVPSNCALSKRTMVHLASDGKRLSVEKVLGNCANASFFWMTSSFALAVIERMSFLRPMILSASSSETLEIS